MDRKQKKEALLQAEAAREYYSKRAYDAEDPFYGAFYAQCVESSAADLWETLCLVHTGSNFFAERVEALDARGMKRLFRLAGIHHTIRVLLRKKKLLIWEDMMQAAEQVYELSAQERKMADILYRAACIDKSGFFLLFSMVTARYVFFQKELTPFQLAFLENFWYNSYSGFMGAFTAYVPFHIRWKQTLKKEERTG